MWKCFQLINFYIWLFLEGMYKNKVQSTDSMLKYDQLYIFIYNVFYIRNFVFIIYGGGPAVISNPQKVTPLLRWQLAMALLEVKSGDL